MSGGEEGRRLIVDQGLLSSTVEVTPTDRGPGDGPKHTRTLIGIMWVFRRGRPPASSGRCDASPLWRNERARIDMSRSFPPSRKRNDNGDQRLSSARLAGSLKADPHPAPAVWSRTCMICSPNRVTRPAEPNELSCYSKSGARRLTPTSRSASAPWPWRPPLRHP